MEYEAALAKYFFNDEEEFDTEEEARAFQFGINYVNDSSIAVEAIVKRDGKFVVLIQDDDKEGK